MLIKTNRDMITDSPLYNFRSTPAQKARALKEFRLMKSYFDEDVGSDGPAFKLCGI